MSSSKPWPRKKPWILPKGLFDIPTSPITPTTVASLSNLKSSAVSSPHNLLTSCRHTRISNSLATDPNFVLQSLTDDHGMTHTHPEKRSNEARAINNEARRSGVDQKRYDQPVPWPMPPKRNEFGSSETATTDQSHTKASNSLARKERKSERESPRKPASVASLERNMSSSNDDFKTPPESIDSGEPDRYNQNNDHSGENIDFRVPRAVFDRIAKLYPPAPRAPTFPDFKDCLKLQSDSIALLNFSSEGEENVKNEEAGSESSTSVVDVLQLFADADDNPDAIEEDGVQQPPSIDHVRIHRKQAPIPRGIGDKSFLNVGGLRSLFDDKHTPESGVFPPVPPDSVKMARVNALHTTSSNGSHSTVPRSRSELPPSSTRHVSESLTSTLVRSKSARHTEPDVGDILKRRKKKKRKWGKERHIKGDTSENMSYIETAKHMFQDDDEIDNKVPSPFQSGCGKEIFSHAPDSPSMKLSPSSAAESSVPSSPAALEVSETMAARTGHVLPKRSTASKNRTFVIPRGSSKERGGSFITGNRPGIIVGGTGVFIRENMRRPPMDGIARAETGWIAGPGELHGDGPPTAVRENPNPKSLAMFNVDDIATNASVPTVSRALPSVLMSEESSATGSDSDSSILDEPLSRSLVNLSIRARGGSAASSSSDGVNRLQAHSSEGAKAAERKYPIGEDTSFKLVHRLRRAAGVLGVRKKTGETLDSGTSDLMMTGSLDEAVVRICYVCRRILDFRVDVREGGRKIRVESKQAISNGSSLRVTLVLTELGDVDKWCTLKVLQSRADANRTNIATLWDFYRKLERLLRNVEDAGAIQTDSGVPNRLGMTSTDDNETKKRTFSDDRNRNDRVGNSFTNSHTHLGK